MVLLTRSCCRTGEGLVGVFISAPSCLFLPPFLSLRIQSHDMICESGVPVFSLLDLALPITQYGCRKGDEKTVMHQYFGVFI